MAKANYTSKITTEITISLNESEARALAAFAGYNIDEFLQVFYRQMGRTYLGPHESGLRSLFNTVRETLSPGLRDVDDARKLLAEEKYNRERGLPTKIKSVETAPAV